jgi:phage replication-related protein YjqB (UPF0714/DUF867 family)
VTDGDEPFAELLATEGVEEVLELRSRFGFLAFHGGSLERMTDVIAGAAAERAGASLYAVLQPPELRWHLPSARFSPAVSPALARFVDHVEVAVALHGYGRHGRWTSLLLGGTNRELAAHVGRSLAAVEHHEVVTELDAIPPELRGLHPDNPVNLPAGGGVQLELPPRVRGLTPHWAGWSGPGLPPPTEALVEALAEAAAGWPLAQGDSRSSTQPEAVAR